MRSGTTPSSRALFADLTEFVHDHRPHGAMTADATVFERWVTSVDAEVDLVQFASLN